MSVVVAGPRRTYVLLLLWERAARACRLAPASERAAAGALEEVGRGEASSPPPRVAPSPATIVCRVRLLRRVAGALVGLVFYVLAPTP